MIPGSIGNIAMFAGADYTFQDTIYQADGTTAQNITGWQLTFSMYAYADPSTVFLTKSVALGNIAITDAADGVMEIYFTAAETASFRGGQYGYSVSRTGSGVATPFMSSGLLSLIRDPNATS